MEKTISSLLSESASLKSRLAQDSAFIAQVAKGAAKIKEVAGNGGTIYVCGNGGSACDAMHFSEELVARYKRERPGIRAMHFGDPGILTCWSNDYDYASAFERQAKTFCTNKDLLVGISTSGKSPNVLKAFAAAKAAGSYTIGLAGKDGGSFPSACDLPLIVPHKDTERIQEVHITIIHLWCELLET